MSAFFFQYHCRIVNEPHDLAGNNSLLNQVGFTFQRICSLAVIIMVQKIRIRVNGSQIFPVIRFPCMISAFARTGIIQRPGQAVMPSGFMDMNVIDCNGTVFFFCGFPESIVKKIKAAIVPGKKRPDLTDEVANGTYSFGVATSYAVSLSRRSSTRLNVSRGVWPYLEISSFSCLNAPKTRSSVYWGTPPVHALKIHSRTKGTGNMEKKGTCCLAFPDTFACVFVIWMFFISFI
ncbi:MAG: hypothetical protein LBL57_06575 [Tannerella sp.]|jgi:hypothetical protein|nr:hypothetical protein [Tannerella sp.]